MNTLAEQVVQAVERAIGPADELVLLHRPYLPPAAWTYVKDCLDTGWVSSAGAYVTRFEELLAQQTGSKRAVATVNGTAALEVCFHLAGVRSGDEVMAPSLTFVATANAIAHTGAVPHFVDICSQRLAISPRALAERLESVGQRRAGGLVNRETGRRIAAVCAMHCLGHPADMDELAAVCQRHELPLIEDAAESLGSSYKGRQTGQFGLLSAVSFNGNKILTTGGGGAILTNDDGLADRARHLTTTGKVPHTWEFYHDEVAWNFRLPNLNAALGVAQIEQLDRFIQAKRDLAARYRSEFAECSDLKFIEEPRDSCSNYWLNGILLSEEAVSQRDAILESLNAAQYQSRPLWRPMHELPMYRDCPHGPLSDTERLQRRIVNIPSSVDLSPSWDALMQMEPGS